MTNSDVIALATSMISQSAFGISFAALLHERRQRMLDNLVTLKAFLHADDLSTARRRVREGSSSIGLDDEHFRRVCSTFDFAATLVRHGAVDKATFLDYWRIPLLSLSARMEAIGQELTGSVTIERYYKDFFWLIREAKADRR